MFRRAPGRKRRRSLAAVHECTLGRAASGELQGRAETEGARVQACKARRVLGRVAVLAAAFVGVGCIGAYVETPRTPPVDPAASVPRDGAVICVLRRVLGGGTHLVRDNGRLVGGTSGKGYFCYRARPGAHRVTSQVGDSTAALDLTLGAGERVFLAQGYHGEDVELARTPEAAARTEVGRLPFEALVSFSEPVMPATDVAIAAADVPPPPSSELPRAALAPPAPPRRRPTGFAYGLAAGLGAGVARTAPATQTTGGFAALGSLWAGVAPSDLLVLGGRLDLSLVNGASAADLARHVAVFPAGERSGWQRDVMVFADGGLRMPTSTDPSSGDAHLGAAARLGLGWEGWRLGPVVLGPFAAGQITRGAGESDGAVVVGVGASHYPAPQK
jgi:hypothetical protein